MAKKETRFSVENQTMQSATMTQIITDKETGVQYLLAVFPSFGAGLTVMVNSDGKPLLNADSK